MNAFVPTARSRAKRNHRRARYDRETIYAVLDAAVIYHIAHVVDGQPDAEAPVHACRCASP